MIIQQQRSVAACAECWHLVNVEQKWNARFRVYDGYASGASIPQNPWHNLRLPFPSLPSPFVPFISFPFPSLRSRTPSSPVRGSGEHCELCHQGLGRSPSRNRSWCILALKYDIWSLVATILIIFSENQLTKFKLCSPNFLIFVPPEDFCDALCVAGGAFGRPGLLHTVVLVKIQNWQLWCVMTMAAE